MSAPTTLVRKTIILVLVLGTIGAILLMRKVPDDSFLDTDKQAQSKASASSQQQTEQKRAERKTMIRSNTEQIATSPVAVAPSLVDTEVDAQLQFDDQGQLIADLNLRRYFDYFLTTIGELSLAAIQQALSKDLSERLDPAQSARALQIFERYLEYLTAVESIVPVHSLEGRFEQLVDLRRRTLGEELADNFYGLEETYTRTVLTEQSIQQDQNLQSAERQRALDELHQQLPDELRSAREQSIAHHLAVEQQQQYQQLNISRQQRLQERTALYGAEAAERLAQLDATQQEWQQRLNDYQQQREQILNGNTDPSDQQTAIVNLRESLFDSNEQKRVESLERIGFPDPSDGF